MILASCVLALTAAGVSGEDTAPSDDKVHIAALVYGEEMTGVCFADDFLNVVGRETEIDIARTLDLVHLSSETLFEFPFAIMTGEGAFDLSDAEKQNLRDYVGRGGLLLASAGCSNQEWTNSFRRVMAEMFGEEAFEPIPLEHPAFHTLYDIDTVRGRKSKPVDNAIYGLTHDGRLRVIFAPMGLNDTANAGEGCCCCGGNEIENAREINANLVVYALTH